MEQPSMRHTKQGLVMLCDVDLSFPDATRTHTIEVARAFARRGLHVELVARGSVAPVAGAAHLQARYGQPLLRA
jgi:hypothetical protein